VPARQEDAVRFIVSLLFLIAIACSTERVLLADSPKDSALSKEDREYLDGLFRDFLFDPTGAERVRVKVVKHGRWANSEPEPRDGWLVKGKKGEPDRVYFTDGFSILAPPVDKIERIDFLAPIKKFFSTRQPPEEETGPWVIKTSKAILGESEAHLTLAAWLYRLGQDEYARKMLSIARALSSNDPRDPLRESLASTCFASLRDKFASAADEDALVCGEHYLRVFSDVDEKTRVQAEVIVSDLKRRRSKGTFGKKPVMELPKELASWSKDKKLAYLITSLEDLCAPSFVGTGHIPFLDDFRITALISLGESAVPALIEAMDKDTRLTRHPEHDVKWSAPTGNIHRVSEAATVAVMSILRTRRFPELENEDDQADHQRILGARIRKYWNDYGKFPFDERMMQLLTDGHAFEHFWRTATENLARWDGQPRYSPWGWSTAGPPEKSWPNPSIAKFKNPTVAEAIVTAMDRDWNIQLGRGPGNGAFCAWPETEQQYLDHLVELGDPRIAPELDRRARNAEDSDVRRKYAFAALQLGSSGEWTRFARDVGRGTVKLESAVTRSTSYVGRTNEEVELSNIVAALVRAKNSDAELALVAMSDPRHPYYPVVADSVLKSIGAWHDSPWQSHPFCLMVLRRGLTDLTDTDGKWSISGDRIEGKARGWSLGSGIPSQLADPKQRRENASERLCDVAGMRLNEIVAGLPFFHVLQIDRDGVIANTMELFDMRRNHFRVMTGNERDRIHMGSTEPGFIPDIQPLGRPATADDVKHGLAVFELSGKGKAADTKLPAWLLLKSEAKQEYPAFGLIVQAETDADGKLIYGVIFRHEIRAVKAEEVERVEAYEGKRR
jgi:hypothetical protein